MPRKIDRVRFAGEHVFASADFRKIKVLALDGAFAAEDDQRNFIVAGVRRIGFSFSEREDAE
ncbi:MAG: hypothetical protein V8T87_07925 [Victivallales bacterium]